MIFSRRSFGNGPKVSLFTLGTMRAVNSQDQMLEIMRGAYDAGINHIETAPSYGHAEKYIGNILNNNKIRTPDDGWVITTKIIPNGDIDNLKVQLKNSLKNLKVKKIDNLAIHGINNFEHLKWSLRGDGSKLIEWALKKNIIGQVGFSSHGKYELIEDLIKSNFFSFCSLHLHLFDQSKIPLARLGLNKGLGIMAISPAHKGGGLNNPSLILSKTCIPYSPLEIAYRFLINIGVSTLTLGASSSNDFLLAKKLSNCTNTLSNEEKKVIERIDNLLKNRLKDTLCEQCGKCLPCPDNVPIPEILRLRNLALGIDQIEFSKERYNLIGRADHWWETIKANSCSDCNECIPKCPHNLKIPDLLKETHFMLNDSPRRRLWG